MSKQFAERDPSQKKFLAGWLKRTEERRRQALPFAFPPPVLLERGQRALDQARAVVQQGADYDQEARRAALDEAWTVVGIIEQHQQAGSGTPDEAAKMREFKGRLLGVIGRIGG
ncbi:MAG: hypothetical protein GEU90_16155 [Gemmatimonas sp.]|nr:hypothetical protein [Gemmatimonas sp.]